jgi:hypothetical protein
VSPVSRAIGDLLESLPWFLQAPQFVLQVAEEVVAKADAEGGVEVVGKGVVDKGVGS